MIFTSCAKEDQSSAETTGSKVYSVQNVSPVPATFTKKVLIEEFVGTSYGNSPEASWTTYQKVKGGSDKVYAASLHLNDQMYTTHSQNLISGISPGQTPSLPTSMVDRMKLNGTTYLDAKTMSNLVTAKLSKPASCGLAINSSTSNGLCQIEVHTGFTSNMVNNLNVTAYLLEDRVVNKGTAFNQVNLSNTTPGSPYYLAGNPILGYVHRYVVRQTLTPPMGKSINPVSMIAGNSEVHSFTIDLPKKLDPTSKFYILAFISQPGVGGQYEVLNVQQAEINTLKDWN